LSSQSIKPSVALLSCESLFSFPHKNSSSTHVRTKERATITATMPKMNNLTRRKELRRLRQSELYDSEEGPLASSSLFLVTPRKVSNEDIVNEQQTTCHSNHLVTPPLTRDTKFNEDGTYRMDVACTASSPPRLQRSWSSSSSSSSSSSTRSLKRSSGSLKRCLVDLTELNQHHEISFLAPPEDNSSSESSLVCPVDPDGRQVVTSGSDTSNWGHFIDEVAAPVQQPFPIPRNNKRRHITIKSRHQQPLKGFFLTSVEEATKELDALRF